MTLKLNDLSRRCINLEHEECDIPWCRCCCHAPSAWQLVLIGLGILVAASLVSAFLTFVFHGG